MINYFKTIHSLFIIFILFSIPLNSQNVQWQNTIGGSDYESLFSIELAKDGNYILGGYSFSNISGDKTENSKGSSDYWITKIDDSSGDILWQKTIGGNRWDRATSTRETKDGGYIIGGYSNSNISGEKTENSRGGDDYWVVKLGSNRNVIWDKTFGGTGVDRLWSIIETDDGGFLMGGESDSDISGDKNENSRGLNDMWVIKTDSNGNIEWQKTYGGSDRDILKSIVKSSDGGYILAGMSMSNISGEKTENSRGLGDYWVLKIDALGNILWQRTIGGDNGDGAKSIQSTSDGNFIVGGDSASNISGEKTENSICNSEDIWVIKLDNNGQILWDKTIGGDSTEWIGNIRETADNGLVIGAMSHSDISGYKTESSNGDRDYWIVKLDGFGNVEWDKTLGGSDIDQLTSIVQAIDGSYVIGGWSSSNISGDKNENTNGLWDYWIVKLKMNSSDYASPLYSSTTICEGDNLELNATSGVFYKWSGPNGFSSTEQNPIIADVSSLNSGFYNVSIFDNASCVDTRIINVTITPSLLNNSIDDLFACDDNADGFAFFNLEQLKSDVFGNLNDDTVSFYRENGQLIPDQELPAVENMIKNEETITVKVENSDATCPSETNFKLIASPPPMAYPVNDLTGCDDNNDSISEYFDTSKIKTTVLGNQTGMIVTYFDSKGNLLPSPLPNPYTNVTPNEVITVRVAKENNPDCFNEVSFNLITNECGISNVNFPDFFTPNNDGINDYWPKNSNAKFIYIYDRYGKLLKTLPQNSIGWDGTYNGKLLPSNDYWYVAIAFNGETITGHFSLIRKN